MKVLKFGGTSVGSPENIKKVLNIVRTSHASEPCIVVVSAFTQVTDELIALARTAAQRVEYVASFERLESRHFEAVRALVSVQEQPSLLARIKKLTNELSDILKGISLIGELTPQTQDLIMSFGERLSATCIGAACVSDGIQAEALDARSCVLTDDHFGGAGVHLEETYATIKRYFSVPRPVTIVTGFIGATADGHTTTLGRGGSDYTASLVGAALGVSVIEIWTDVDGFMTADPRIVPTAQYVSHMTYEEAMELSYFGAKVIYYPTIHPAYTSHIPLVIKNTFHPDAPGTLISQVENPLHLPVTAVTSTCDVALIRIQGIGLVGVAGTARRVFRALGAASINVILISQASSEYSICVAVDSSAKERARSALNEEFTLEINKKSIEPVVVENTSAIIAVIGVNMRKTPGTAGRIFSAIGREKMNIKAIAQGSSELNISFVVDQHDRERALQVVHAEFFGSSTKRTNIFLIGTGLIGSTLLRQIRDHTRKLLEKDFCDLRVVGIANAEKMFTNGDGIECDSWESVLASKGSQSNAHAFILGMKALALPNSVFVDCTASADVANEYEGIIDAGIAIVTANKKANSGDYARSASLHRKVREKGVPFLYETNVGAALPVIATLQDFVRTGDQIKVVEAILSGTLSYIFNTYSSSDRAFSDIVREAQEKGYTEPDPRDDLSGMDVARKVVILAREMGGSLEVNDVVRAPIVPADCFDVASVDEFFTVLQRHDEDFNALRKEAREKGCALRFIACIDENGARMQLQQVDSSHPFYSLSGSDNIISFTTQRYCTTPLVIKGPGAGAEVTAGGVFADILKAL